MAQTLDSTGKAERLSGRDWSRSERTDSNIKSINDLHCNEDGQPRHSKGHISIKCV